MTLVSDVIQALHEVYDPESGQNVVDLGLVYGVTDLDGDICIQMTMTRDNCPMTAYIVGMAEAVVRQMVIGVRSVSIELVWSPRWTPAMTAQH
tara:strand:- start:378 stop:656 length:279 start_codon:yes stop_codon:yes gene_type:complete